MFWTIKRSWTRKRSSRGSIIFCSGALYCPIRRSVVLVASVRRERLGWRRGSMSTERPAPTTTRPLARGHVPQTSLRRVIVYVPDELYARLQTAAWVRRRRRPFEPYSVGAVVREVLDAVLPDAVPGADQRN
jgi:hypothetical protein